MGRISVPAASALLLVVVTFLLHRDWVTEATGNYNSNITSTETTFELSCFTISIDFNIPDVPPTLRIDCIANGTIAEMFCIYDNGTASEMITECALPIIISLNSTIFKPGVHTITIVANSTAGDVATFSDYFDLPFRIDCFVGSFMVFGSETLTFDCGIANGYAVELFCIYDNGTALELITKCTLPVYIHLDPTSFVPGPHTITIVANSATGEVATFSYNFIVPDIIDFRCIQLTEPGNTVVICKTSQPDAISECGLSGSFENATLFSLLSTILDMGIKLNCDNIILQSSRIPPGTYNLHIEALYINGPIFNGTSIPVSISEPQLVECRTSYDCTTNGTRMSAEECCVHYANGLAYTIADQQECHVCIVFGWFQDSFIGMERGLRYLLQAGYQKGASHVNNSLHFEVASRMENASSLDFLVENDTLIIEGSGGPQNLFVTFFEDGVSQESNETFTINLEPTFPGLESLPSGEAVFFMRSVKMTIVDNDRVRIAFSESDYQISEFSQNMLIEITKDTRIASSIILSIIPQTIDVAMLSGGSLPMNIPPDDPRSPNRASTEDFMNRVLNVTFEADENRSSSVLSVLAALPVIDDEINEATEVFTVQLVLTGSVDPGMITLTSPAASLCTIVDDDPIKIGFEHSSYSFRESDSQQSLFLTKESGRDSEQSFLLLIQLSDSGFTLPDSSIQLATLGLDVEIANATNQEEPALTLEFTPSQQRVDFSLEILQDSIPEEIEVFRARLLMPGVGPMGTPGYVPYRNNVFSEALIYIRDDDRFVLGFDETAYEVSESAGAIKICVQVFNPPNHLHFSTTIPLHVLTVDGSASVEDYEQLSSSSFSVQLNFTDDYRYRCFNVTIVDDDISEQVENFHVQLVADSPSSLLSIDLLPRNATVHIVDDDGTKLNVPYTF